MPMLLAIGNTASSMMTSVRELHMTYIRTSPIGLETVVEERPDVQRVRSFPLERQILTQFATGSQSLDSERKLRPCLPPQTRFPS
jgi:hypothetical protein